MQPVLLGAEPSLSSLLHFNLIIVQQLKHKLFFFWLDPYSTAQINPVSGLEWVYSSTACFAGEMCETGTF